MNFQFLQACLQDFRRTKRKVAIAWLDLQNAFGSVPIDHLLRRSGMVVEKVRNIYTDSTTRITVGAYRIYFEPISCIQGVKQGNPTLFWNNWLKGVEDQNGGDPFDEFTPYVFISIC